MEHWDQPGVLKPNLHCYDLIFTVPTIGYSKENLKVHAF